MYYTRYKIANVDIDQHQINLNDNALIIKDEKYRSSPSREMIDRSFPGSLSRRFMSSQIKESLIQSDVILEVRVTSDTMENDPFNIDRCINIALALAITFENSFYCGFGTQDEFSTPNTYLTDDQMALFYGDIYSKISINSTNLSSLIQNHEFISNCLKISEDKLKDKEKIKLALLFLRCISNIGSSSYHVLDISTSDILNDINTGIANSHLFLEYILTRESTKRNEGIRIWNSLYGPTESINQDEIDIIWSYRHTIFHDNPTAALAKIAAWLEDQGLDPQDPSSLGRGRQTALMLAIKNIKRIMRTISLSYDTTYQTFKSTLP